MMCTRTIRIERDIESRTAQERVAYLGGGRAKYVEKMLAKMQNGVPCCPVGPEVTAAAAAAVPVQKRNMRQINKRASKADRPTEPKTLIARVYCRTRDFVRVCAWRCCGCVPLVRPES